MGAIQRLMENAASGREGSDLGGTVTFGSGDAAQTLPCSMGVDTNGLTLNANGSGLQSSSIKRIIVRNSQLITLSQAPKSGDICTLKNNLEDSTTQRTIAMGIGIENMNGIITAINFQDVNQGA